ncbi:hypothetical protein [Corynebacterium halotolerans]|uniref:Anti-sigma-D factor RsdA sigma factor binding region domain-containing protein n=1 Tax=Corynebacterium halotolerans YIM 70093 = DSM 44683 TaxID=1121362 RepID=M1NJN7_9CORY|nr:hypothetical protein [Corynebacterium halotolerans]AGF71608.1 hypothetical protein A605_02970 [Corynebacterium halotolerans YIM 70093 = DSM 44683]
MTKRRNEDAPTADVTDQLKPLVDDDAFLTELSRGVNPSDGQDELAALLLELRGDVEKQMPPAPVVEGADEEPAVISLGERRRRRRGRPILSGLIGAAAATLVIAGSGTVLYNATPGSPLWGVSSALFDDRAAVVELASTLEEMDSRAAEGDMDGTRALLVEARNLLDGMREQNRIQQDTSATPAPAPDPLPTTVTEQAEPTGTPEPVTETTTVTDVQTETATETAVATVTVTQAPPIRDNPLPNPNPNPNPTTQPTQPGEPTAPTTSLAPPQTQSPVQPTDAPVG